MKNWTEISGTETANEKKKLNETESQFFENLYENDKPLGTLKWKRNQGQKLSVWPMNWKGHHCWPWTSKGIEKVSTHSSDYLGEMDKFFKR